MIKLNPHTITFVEEYIDFYYNFLSRSKYNHFAARIEARKMSQVNPRSISGTGILQENSLSKSLMKEERSTPTARHSRVQPSVIKAVQPMMLDVMKSFDFNNTSEAVVKAVELTERTWAKQMSGRDKHEYAKLMLRGIVKEEDGSEGNMDEIIELIVMVAKNRTLVNLFKKSGKACLSCCK